MMPCVLCPPYIWGRAMGICFRTDGYKISLRQPSHMWLQSHGIETGPPHSLHPVHHSKEMGDALAQLFIELRSINNNWMQSWWISVKVLVGDLESSLFRIPSNELICSNSGQLLKNMHFHQLNCPLEQEYPDQVCFHGKNCWWSI